MVYPFGDFIRFNKYLWRAICQECSRHLEGSANKTNRIHCPPGGHGVWAWEGGLALALFLGGGWVAEMGQSFPGRQKSQAKAMRLAWLGGEVTGSVPRAVEVGGEGEQGQGQNSRWAELHACPWNLGRVLSPIHEGPPEYWIACKTCRVEGALKSPTSIHL